MRFSMQKGVFNLPFLVFCLVLVSVLGGFFVFFFGKRLKKAISCSLSCFSLLFPQKPFLQSSSLLLRSLPLLLFPVEQNTIFVFLFLHQPLSRKHFLLFALCFLSRSPFLSYFLLLSFKQTALRSPFSNPSCFHFGLFGSSIVVLLFCSKYFCWRYLLVFWFVFSILVVSVASLSDYEKHCFHESLVFLVFCWLEGCFSFLTYVFVLAFCCVVLFLKLECFICVCVVWSFCFLLL